MTKKGDTTMTKELLELMKHIDKKVSRLEISQVRIEEHVKNTNGSVGRHEVAIGKIHEDIKELEDDIVKDMKVIEDHSQERFLRVEEKISGHSNTLAKYAGAITIATGIITFLTQTVMKAII